MIRLENVSKTFQGKSGAVEAVRPVTLSIGEGEVFGIIGFSGAGKSTLVRLMNLLEKPTAGRVYVDGQELTRLAPKALRQARRKIGMIFQQFNLSESRTVFENVAYPLRYKGLSREKIAKRVEELIGLVELGGKERSYPGQLSGGQKQRVALARALATEPKILLCDEATSALDPQTTLSILRLLKRLNRELGITIVVITHEMAVVKEICGRVAVMEDGRVVEQGDVYTVFAEPREKITRDFIDTTTNLSKIHGLIDENAAVTRLGPGETLVKLQYRRGSVAQALVSQISRRFGVDANIIFGNIELIGADPLGALIVILSGGDVAAAIEYLKAQHVDVEVILSGSAA